MAASVAWGLCTTLKATPDQTRAFVAHHLALGAARMWLFFDDPDDPAVAAVAHLPQVTAVRCDAAHWGGAAHRPDTHQNRQTRNMRMVYAASGLPWVGHIDADEFLWPARDIGAVLADVPGDRPMLRMAPWEALHDPALPDDIFTARQFRAALRGNTMAGLRQVAFGAHADLLPDGVLSHSVGKCFFRTGIHELQPRLHGAFARGRRVPAGSFTADIALLHFHAEDPARWLDRLAFRLTRGAYQFNPPLAAWLSDAGPEAQHAFYHRVQNPSPAVRAALRDAGTLLEAELDLRARAAALVP